jgi:hypothetical protein
MYRQTFRGEVCKTTDGGQTWNSISYPIILQKGLVLFRADPNIMYFTIPTTRYVPYTPTLWQRDVPRDFSDFGVYRSKNAGVMWSWLNSSGLPANRSVARLEMDLNNSNVI